MACTSYMQMLAFQIKNLNFYSKVWWGGSQNNCLQNQGMIMHFDIVRLQSMLTRMHAHTYTNTYNGSITEPLSRSVNQSDLFVLLHFFKFFKKYLLVETISIWRREVERQGRKVVNRGVGSAPQRVSAVSRHFYGVTDGLQCERHLGSRGRGAVKYTAVCQTIPKCTVIQAQLSMVMFREENKNNKAKGTL